MTQCGIELEHYGIFGNSEFLSLKKTSLLTITQEQVRIFWCGCWHRDDHSKLYSFIIIAVKELKPCHMIFNVMFNKYVGVSESMVDAGLQISNAFQRV